MSLQANIGRGNVGGTVGGHDWWVEFEGPKTVGMRNKAPKAWEALRKVPKKTVQGASSSPSEGQSNTEDAHGAAIAAIAQDDTREAEEFGFAVGELMEETEKLFNEETKMAQYELRLRSFGEDDWKSRGKQLWGLVGASRVLRTAGKRGGRNGSKTGLSIISGIVKNKIKNDRENTKKAVDFQDLLKQAISPTEFTSVKNVDILGLLRYYSLRRDKKLGGGAEGSHDAEREREVAKLKRFMADETRRVTKALRVSTMIESAKVKQGTAVLTYVAPETRFQVNRATDEALSPLDKAYNGAQGWNEGDVKAVGFYTAFVDAWQEWQKELERGEETQTKEDFQKTWAVKLGAAYDHQKDGKTGENLNFLQFVPQQEHIAGNENNSTTEKSTTTTSSGDKSPRSSPSSSVDPAQIARFLRVAAALPTNAQAFPTKGRRTGAKQVYAARPSFTAEGGFWDVRYSAGAGMH